MKIVVWMLVVLLAAVAVAAAVVTRQARSWPDCASNVVIRTGPDGRPVELRQLAALPTGAPAEGEIVGGRLAITVGDLEKTVAVYRGALGFDVTAPTRFAIDPFVRTLTGVRGEVRRSLATSPGNGQVFELTEFRGVERTSLQTRLQDPGSVRLQVMVRGINEVTEAVDKVMSFGKPVELAPQSAHIRRLQHQLIEQHGLGSESRGEVPWRRDH